MSCRLTSRASIGVKTDRPKHADGSAATRPTTDSNCGGDLPPGTTGTLRIRRLSPSFWPKPETSSNTRPEIISVTNGHHRHDHTLDEPVDRTAVSSAERLRGTTAAIRLSFTWFGTRKTLTPEQKAQAADTFGAEGDFLSAGKKLIDTKHPAFKAVTGVRGRIVSYWRGISLPYPEPGIRSFGRMTSTRSTCSSRHSRPTSRRLSAISTSTSRRSNRQPESGSVACTTRPITPRRYGDSST